MTYTPTSRWRRLLCVLAALTLLGAGAPVASAQWRPATYASPAEHEVVWAGDLAADASGRLTAVWSWWGQAADAPDAIASAGRAPGAAWATAAAPLDDVDEDQRYLPDPGLRLDLVLATNARGDAVAMWILHHQASGVDDYNVKAAYRPAGGEWGPAHTLETDGYGKLEAIVAPDGSAWLAWRKTVAANWEIRTARVSAAGVFSAGSELATSPGPQHTEFSLAVDPRDGSAAMVFGRHVDGRQYLRLIRHGAGAAATWSTPVDLTSDPSRVDTLPRAAFEADGDLRLVWLSDAYDDLADHRVRGMRVVAGSNTPGSIEPIGTTTADLLTGLDLAITPAGDAAVAWAAETGDANTTVRVAHRDAGATEWTAHDAATGVYWTGNGSHAQDPDVVVAADGSATVAWVAGAQSGRALPWAVQRPAGGAWAAAQPLPVTTDGTGASNIHLAPGAAGVVHAAWIEFTGDVTSRLAYTTTEAAPSGGGGEPGGGGQPGGGTSPGDAASPQIHIQRPGIGQRFAQGQPVTVAYSCTDDVAVASCQGPVPNGGRLDTATLGAHSFRVVARDAAGHEAITTHGYFVDPVSPPGFAPLPLDSIKELAERISKGMAQAKQKDLLGSGIVVKAVAKTGTIAGSILIASQNTGKLKPSSALPQLIGGRLQLGRISMPAAGGRLISHNGLGYKKRPKAVTLAHGGHVFTKDGEASYRIKLTTAGRKALVGARKHGRGAITVTLLTVSGSSDGSHPIVVVARKIKLR